MSDEKDARPLTSVELLDAAVWREIDSDEAQPQAAFLEALSHLVGRWLMVRSDAPGMDVVTVLCKARGYIARQEVRQTTNDEIEWITRCYRLRHCAQFGNWSNRWPAWAKELAPVHAEPKMEVVPAGTADANKLLSYA